MLQYYNKFWHEKGENHMKKKIYIFVAIILLLVSGGVTAFGIHALASTNKDNISKGVFIDTVDIGGMTKDQATKAVEDYILERESKTLTIKVDDNTIVSTLKDLGYKPDPNSYIEEALMVGKSGNLIKRYKEIKDTEAEGLVYTLEFSLDDNKLNDLVNKKCSKFNIPSKNASMKRENGNFLITDHEIGRKVVVDETIEKIKSTILTKTDENDITMEAVVIDDVPQYKKDSLEKIDNVLGSFQTTYNSSSASRANNLAVGAKFIDGTVLYPGEIFSAYEYLTPFTIENGYSTAGAYSQGMVIDSIGGGACQVSSTLYNAVIRAELEIVERAAHSMSVGYVKPSADAAIAGTYKDLKFKNNLETPIYIQGYTVGRTITFTIYGEETRDTQRRRIEFVSEVESTTQPPKEVITEDPTKPITYRKVTQSAHTGLKAKLYKVIYEDGEEISRVLINSSSYAAAPAYVIIGTMEEEEEEEKKDKDKKGSDKEKEDSKEETVNPDDTDSGEEDSGEVESEVTELEVSDSEGGLTQEEREEDISEEIEE